MKNKIISGKRGVVGTIFSWALVLIAISILVYASIQFHSKYKMKDELMQDRDIGDYEVMIKNSIQQGEKALYFVDNSAKFAIGNAIYGLAKNGGFYAYFDPTQEEIRDIETKARIMKASPCGSYAMYNLWNNATTDCYPSETLSENLKKTFYDEFSFYLIAYKEYPLNAYDFTFSYVNNEKTGEQFISGMSNGITGIKMIDVSSELEARDRLPEEDMIPGNPVGGGADLIWPLDSSKSSHFVITSCFGNRNCKPQCVSNDHKAIDIDGDTGDKVLAVADGKVIDVGGSYNQVIIQHKNNLYSYYLHNSAVFVKAGDDVTKGKLIAKIGGYGGGNPTRYPSHLHFALKKDAEFKDALDPANGFYSIESLNLKFSRSSNCVYYNSQYSYASLITERSNLA